MFEICAVGVCSAGSDEDGFYAGMFGEVGSEGVFHGLGISCQGEMVFVGGFLDKGRYGRERVGRDDVDAFEGGGEGGTCLYGVGVECREVEDQEDQTVFATVVGEG